MKAKIVVIVSLLILLLVGCNNNADESSLKNNIRHEYKTQQEIDESDVLFDLRKEGYTVEFHNRTNTYILLPSERTSQVVSSIIIDKNDVARRRWLEIRAETRDISKYIHDSLGEGYVVLVLNPNNRNDNYLVAVEGEIIYDITRDNHLERNE